MNKCSMKQIASISLWIAVTITILTAWIASTVQYNESEDTELGRGAALFALTHKAYLIVLGLLTTAAIGASWMRMRECNEGTTMKRVAEEMVSSPSVVSSFGSSNI